MSNERNHTPGERRARAESILRRISAESAACRRLGERSIANRLDLIADDMRALNHRDLTGGRK